IAADAGVVFPFFSTRLLATLLFLNFAISIVPSFGRASHRFQLWGSIVMILGPVHADGVSINHKISIYFLWVFLFVQPGLAQGA
ncbi:unnamed protein product, partial [Prunus brigantina]